MGSEMCIRDRDCFVPKGEGETYMGDWLTAGECVAMTGDWYITFGECEITAGDGAMLVAAVAAATAEAAGDGCCGNAGDGCCETGELSRNSGDVVTDIGDVAVFLRLCEFSLVEVVSSDCRFVVALWSSVIIMLFVDARPTTLPV